MKQLAIYYVMQFDMDLIYNSFTFNMVYHLVQIKVCQIICNVVLNRDHEILNYILHYILLHIFRYKADHIVLTIICQRGLI